jgi:hypothetical protein
MKTFDEDGLSFSYPDDWSIEREAAEGGWTVTLQSPGTAFAIVTLDREMPDVEEVAEATLEALKADYPSLEATSAVETLAGDMAVGHDLEFFSMDFTVSVATRCFYGAAGTVLVLSQVSGLDEEQYEPALTAIRASMRSAEDIDLSDSPPRRPYP